VTKNQLYIEDGAVVFDCTTEAGYINFVEASHHLNDETHQYMVFKMKVDQGGNYANFRLQTKTSGVVWSSAFMAAPGLGSFDSPYVTNDGWTYVVVDLELSGIGTAIDELTLYYSTEGRLIIDSIFFANNEFTRLDLANQTIADTSEVTQVFSAGDDYAYNHLGLANNNPLNQRYLVLLLKGTGLDNFRIQTYDGEVSSEVKYLNQMIGIDGHAYTTADISNTEYRYLAIDLLASGMQLNPDGIHLHLNNAKIYIAEIFFADEVLPYQETVLASYAPVTPTVVDGSAIGYVYTYVGFDQAVDADYLVMVVSGNLASIRFATINHDESVVSNVVYLNQMIGINGLPVAYQNESTEFQTIMIDLAASGLGTNVGALHFHYGDDTATDILTIQEIYLLEKEAKPVIDPATLIDLKAPVSPIVIDGSTSEYVYTYIGLDNPVLGQQYMIITVKGDLTSMRFEAIKANDSTVGAVWVHQWIGIDGLPLVYQATSEEYQTLIIDLVASGIGTDIKAMHFHYGNASATDILTIQSFQAGNILNTVVEALNAALND